MAAGWAGLGRAGPGWAVYLHQEFGKHCDFSGSPGFNLSGV